MHGTMTMARPAVTAFERFSDALEAHGCRVTGSGDQRSAQCPVPAHDDHRASLSFYRAPDTVLINCHGHCDKRDVLAALGWSMADLYDEPRERSPSSGWQVAATYTYEDENGKPLFVVERRQPKDFRQYHVEHGRKVWNLKGVRRVVYRLPRVLAATDADVIFVVEGEKDVHAIEAAGQIATCNPGGEGMGWQDSYSEALAGKDVLVVADRDAKGRKHAAKVAASVQKVARFVWVVEPACGKDAHDHLAANCGITDFAWWA